jgi:hypothetical protein
MSASLIALSLTGCASLSKEDRALLTSSNETSLAAQRQAGEALQTAQKALAVANAADANAQAASVAAADSAAAAKAAAEAAKVASDKADRMFQKSLRK